MVLALLALGTIGKLLTVCTPEGTFAHRFRPTYAGANMGHPYGVVEPVSGLRGRPAGTRPIGAGIGHKSVLEWYKRSRCATEPPRDDQGSCAGFSPYLSRTAGSVSSRVPVDRVHACRCSPPRRPEGAWNGEAGTKPAKDTARQADCRKFESCFYAQVAELLSCCSPARDESRGGNRKGHHFWRPFS
jgi:hypothetical protein